MSKISLKFADLSNELKNKLIIEFNNLYGNNGNKISWNNIEEILYNHALEFVQYKDLLTGEEFISRELATKHSDRGFHHYANRIKILYTNNKISDFQALKDLKPLDLLVEEILIFNPIDIPRIGDVIDALYYEKYHYDMFRHLLQIFAEKEEPTNDKEAYWRSFARKYLTLYRELNKNEPIYFPFKI